MLLEEHVSSHEGFVVSAGLIVRFSTTVAGIRSEAVVPTDGASFTHLFFPYALQSLLDTVPMGEQIILSRGLGDMDYPSSPLLHSASQ